MLAGIGLVALSMVVMLKVTAMADPLAREDLAFAPPGAHSDLLVTLSARALKASPASPATAAKQANAVTRPRIIAKAFEQAARDPEFLEQGRKISEDFSPMLAQDVALLVKRLADTPNEATEYTKVLMRKQGLRVE